MTNRNDENFVGPILKVSFLENIFVFTDSHFISDFEFPVSFRFRWIHSVCNPLRILQSHFVGSHTDSTMERVVVRVNECIQNIDPSFCVATGHVSE